jgi:hypothetical protein
VAISGGYQVLIFFGSQYWKPRRRMRVSLWIRETVGGKRTYRKPNKKKLYPEDTVFCLRYSAESKEGFGLP